MRHHEPAPRRAERPPRGSVRLVLLSGLLLAGCKPHQRYDLIEAELRTRDRELRETRDALEQSRLLNRAYDQQLQSTTPAYSPATGPTKSAVAPGLFLKEIAIGRGTGGVDTDGCLGDEALMVMVTPQDEDGSAVKVPARLTVAAWQVNTQGLKTPVGNWEVPAEKLRPMWKAGLLSTGYSLTLPWQTFPTSDKLRVAVRLTTLDGRSYEADRDVTVHPLPPQRPKTAGGLGDPPVQELPPPGGLIPVPTTGYPVGPVQGYPVSPVVPGRREVLPPASPPTGVAPTVPVGRPVEGLPPGVEELPPPMER